MPLGTLGEALGKGPCWFMVASRGLVCRANARIVFLGVSKNQGP